MPARALLAALAPLFALASSPPARIVIESDPRQVELRPGASATLRINCAEAPRLTASIGEVRPPKPVGKGRFEAVYIPPAETYPQVAFIVAHTSKASGWLPLPLAGQSELEVKADESGMATVTVAGRRFAQQAGPEGKATVAVVVPPGTRYAESGGQRIDLNMPEVAHVYMTVDDTQVPANASGSLAIRVFAVTPDGKPRSNAPVRITADPGTVSTPHEVEPGVYDAVWNLPPSPTATVEARLEDELPVLRATMQRSVSEPQQLRIDVDRTTVTAGDGTLDFTVLAEDSAGHEVDVSTPQVTLNTGTLLGWTRGLPGHWVGHLAIPERLDTSSLVIVATVGKLTTQREIKLAPAAAAAIEFEGTLPSGKSPGTLSVITLDRFGNRTEENPPEASALVGTLGTADRQGPGAYQFSYQPPSTPTTTHDVIRVTAGTAERVLTVELKRNLFEFGIHGGLALSSGAAGPVLGAQATIWAQGGPSRLGLMVDGSWFQFAHNQAVGTSSAFSAFSSTVSYVALTANPTWRLALGKQLMLWGSVGGGVVRVQSSSTLGTQPTIEDSSWVATGTAEASVGLRALGGYPYLAARVSYVGDPHLANLSGSFVPVFLQLGYRFDAF